MARAYVSGSTQYSYVETTPITEMPLTICAWARCPDTTAEHVVGGIFRGAGSGGSDNAWYLTFRGNAANDPLTATQAAGGAFTSANTSSSYRANTWHHCAGVFASSTSRKVYLDAGSPGEDTTSGTPSGVNSIGIAAYLPAVGAYQSWTVDVAEFAIWRTALTQSHILALSKGANPRTILPQSLVFYAPLRGGHTDIDLIGGRVMTLGGNPAITDHPVIYPLQSRRNIIRAAYVAPTGGGTFQNLVGRPFSLAGFHGLAGD